MRTTVAPGKAFCSLREYRRLLILFFLIACAFLLITSHVDARVGGGSHFSGGSHSSSHHSSSSHTSSFHGSSSRGGGSAGVGVIIFLLIFGLILLMLVRYVQRKGREASPFEQEQAAELQANLAGSGIDADGFSDRVKQTAAQINQAWVDGNMNPVRHLLSGALYSRLQLQLQLMKAEGRRNVVSEFNVNSVTLRNFEKEGEYKCLDVLLHARCRDCEVPADATEDAIQKILASTELTSYSECWSYFMKDANGNSRGKQSGLSDHHCPSCGAELPNAPTVKCSYCGVLINSGEYDWVLAEITQLSEWRPRSRAQALDSGVSRQEIEDRSSYLFWRWIECKWRGRVDPLRRFATDAFVQSNRFQPERLPLIAVGGVDLSGLQRNNGNSLATVRVVWSVDEGAPREVQLSIVKRYDVPDLRGLSGVSCEKCGGPLDDLEAAKCSYCGFLQPEKDHGWLLSAVAE